MNKKFFLAIGFDTKADFEKEIVAIRDVLAKRNDRLLIFVNEYAFPKHDEKGMMAQACAEIKSSDAMIAEISHKEMGVGVEIGYAAALNKPVIYLRRKDAEYSRTAGGLVQHHIAYESCDDLRDQLTAVLDNIS